MTASEVRDLVVREIAGYGPSQQTEPLIGTPWPEQKIQERLAELRGALVEPARIRFVCRDTPEEIRADPPIVRQLWLVARTEVNELVFFDETAAEFGLAQGDPARLPETIGVRGDLVGVFCAR